MSKILPSTFILLQYAQDITTHVFLWQYIFSIATKLCAYGNVTQLLQYIHIIATSWHFVAITSLYCNQSSP
jgi:hypothetical protein